MDQIGQDELLSIFQFMDPVSLVRAGRVCKDWYWVSKSNTVWKRQCLKRWSFCNLTTIEPCADIWYKYFSRRMRIDHKLESGRPGMDYKAKSIRFHKSPVLGVVYITSPKSYTKDLTENQIPNPLIASWDQSNIAAWMLHSAEKKWAVELDVFASRKVLYDFHNDQIIYTCSGGAIAFLEAENGNEVRKIRTSSSDEDILAVKLVPVPVQSELYKQGDKQYLFVVLQSGVCQVWSLNSFTGPKFVFYSLSRTDSIAVSPSGLVATTSGNFNEIRVHNYLTFSESTENESVMTISTRPERVDDEDIDELWHHPLRVYHVTGLHWLGKTKQFLVASSYYDAVIFNTSNGKRTNFSCKVDGAQLVTWENMILLGDKYGRLMVYTISDEGDEVEHKIYNDHNGPITGIHVDAYRVLTCSSDLSIRVYKWGSVDEGVGSLVSLYTLLGGSRQFNPDGFRGLVCDYGSCVGWINNVLKCYIFLQ